MKKILILLVILAGTHSYSQNDFKKGYLINNDGIKVDCLIRDQGWMNNPVSFTYMLNENSQKISGMMNNVSEFGIYDGVRYIRKKVFIDRSSNDTNTLTDFRKPYFEEETLFLKLLVEGKANLYSYVDGQIIRYFYDLNSETPSQLIYKKYLISNTRIGENDRYKQQLLTDLNCSDETLKKVSKLRYSEDDLTNYFIEYNQCKGANYTSYLPEKETKKGEFNFYLKMGPDLSFMKVKRGFTAAGTTFNMNTSLKAGSEIEYEMPFNNKKLSAYLQAFYRSYHQEKEYYATYQTNLVVDYRSVEMALGFRYYSYINANTKMYFDAGFVIDKPFNSNIEFEIDSFEENPQSDSFRTTPGATIGVGYLFGERYGLELRGGLGRALKDEKVVESRYNLNWSSNFSSISLLFVYNLF